MRKLISLTLFFCIFTLGIGAIVAQGPVMCPTRPVTDNSNACASTAFVVNYATSGGNIVNTITSTDGSLTLSSPSGAVTIVINAAHTNNWTTPQGFRTIYLNGSTSGFTTLVASPVASGIWTFPNNTDTVVGKATVDTFTNKTYDTAGTGNSFSINSVAVTANTGTGAVARASSPVFVTPSLGAAVATSINGLGLGGTAGKTLSVNNSIALSGTDGTTMTFPSTNGTIATLNIASQQITGGALVSPTSLGAGNFVINCGTRPIQTISNAGAFSITAPSDDGFCLLKIVNTASPSGAITWTGFSVGSNTGDPLTTTSGNKFIVSIIRAGGDSTYSIKALQ